MRTVAYSTSSATDTASTTAADSTSVADSTSATDTLSQLMVAYGEVLRTHREYIDSLNVFPVPDGDTGTNMYLTVASVLKEIEQTSTSEEGGAADGTSSQDFAAICNAISQGSLMGARGNSGVILCQILRGLSKAFVEDGEVSAMSVAKGLDYAKSTAYEAVMDPQEGTILTVLSDMNAEAQSMVEHDLSEMAISCKLAAEESLERTPELLAVLAEAGVVDAGGAGLVLFWDALLHVTEGEELPSAPEESEYRQQSQAQISGQPPEQPSSDTAEILGSASEQALVASARADEMRYEVMYLLHTEDDEAVAGFRQAWAEMGDSVVVVGGDGIWNCHIHTNDIGGAIEAGIEVGRPSQIRITDLFEQVEHVESAMFAQGTEAVDPATSAEAAEQSAKFEKPTEPEETAIWLNPNVGTTTNSSNDSTAIDSEPVKTAIIAVSVGEGIQNLMAQLNVSAIVRGGQTMNPSTELLLEAIRAVEAEEILILPNNKNIVPVAKQAAEQATQEAKEAKVAVLPTTSIPEGIAALAVYRPEANSQENLDEMQAEVADLVVGQVTKAVRTTTIDGRKIEEGDYMGLSDGKVLSSSRSLLDATKALVKAVVAKEHELLTLFAGEPADEETTTQLLSWLKDTNPQLETELHKGNQPLYHYYLSLL